METVQVRKVNAIEFGLVLCDYSRKIFKLWVWSFESKQALEVDNILVLNYLFKVVNGFFLIVSYISTVIKVELWEENFVHKTLTEINILSFMSQVIWFDWLDHLILELKNDCLFFDQVLYILQFLLKIFSHSIVLNLSLSILFELFNLRLN